MVTTAVPGVEFVVSLMVLVVIDGIVLRANTALPRPKPRGHLAQ